MLSSGLSPELAAAQERLLQLRKELLVERGDSHSHARATKHKPTTNRLLHEAQAELCRRREIAGVRVGKNLAFSSSDWIDTLAAQHSPPCVPPPPAKGQGPSSRLETVPVYPSILTAMLKKHLESAGRIYLLLTHLDPQGRGWLSVDHARSQLTGSSSPLRVCGWRRLRQILHQGEGIFWERDHQHRIMAARAAQNRPKTGLRSSTRFAHQSARKDAPGRHTGGQGPLLCHIPQWPPQACAA